jgi:cytochrome bd ubiquinol oxidase subunit I
MWTALLLSRVQFAFTVSFHIIFPSFAIGFFAWEAFAAMKAGD